MFPGEVMMVALQSLVVVDVDGEDDLALLAQAADDHMRRLAETHPVEMLVAPVSVSWLQRLEDY